MSVWRPAPEIRVKALGLCRRGGRLLAAEIFTDDGRVKGVRPLGGGVAFGESAASALAREFAEELGVEIDILGEPLVMENIYAHEGSVGHEVLFVFEIALPAGRFDDREAIVFHEDDGTTCIARWFALDELDRAGGPALYPAGLKALLEQGA